MHGPRRGSRRVLEHVPVAEGNGALCRVDVDFGRFDRDPHSIPAVEPELAYRDGCHLGNDRGQAREPNADAVTLQVEIGRATLPDIAWRAVRPRAIQRHRARMKDGKDVAIWSSYRRQRSAAGQCNQAVARSPAKEVDADQVGDVTRAGMLRDLRW